MQASDKPRNGNTDMWNEYRDLRAQLINAQYDRKPHAIQLNLANKIIEIQSKLVKSDGSKVTIKTLDELGVKKN